MHGDPQVNTFWWNKQSNFGDAMNVPLLEHFSAIRPVWAPPNEVELVAIGSVLHSLPLGGWHGTVAGSGVLFEHMRIDLRHADVQGLRGPLTMDRVILNKHADPVLADPGLLASELVPARHERHRIGVVPHVSDNELWEREVERARKAKYGDLVLIDPTLPPTAVISMIGGCERIVSSSLHGIIVADSFGIPRRAERFTEMDTNKWQGGEFKFQDYGASIGQEVVWSTLQTAPAKTIFRLQAELFDMLTELRCHV